MTLHRQGAHIQTLVPQVPVGVQRDRRRCVAKHPLDRLDVRPSTVSTAIAAATVTGELAAVPPPDTEILDDPIPEPADLPGAP